MSRGPHRTTRLVFEAGFALAGAALLVWAWRVDRTWFELHVGDQFCTVDPAQEHTRTVWRWLAAGAGAVLALGVAPLAGRWASRRTLRSAMVDVAGIVVASLLALVVCEVYLRHKDGGRPDVGLLPPLLDHPRYGWAYPPRTSTTVTLGPRDIIYADDALGDRARSVDWLPDLDRPTILLVGESFTNGIGVQWSESLAALLERDLGLQVVDTSVWAWDHGQEYLRMQDVLPRLAHPVAVVVGGIGQQLDRDDRDARQWHPRFTVDGDALRPLPRSSDWWIESALRWRVHDLVSLHGDAAIGIARAAYTGIAKAARGRGAYPLVFLTNWGSPCILDADGSSPLERRLFDGLDVPHLRVDLPGDTQDAYSYHPGPRGQEMLAAAVEGALVDAGVAHRVAPPSVGP